MWFRLPNSIIMIDDFPVELFQGYRLEQVIITVPQVKNQLRLESSWRIKSEGRPLIGINFILNFLFFISFFFVFISCYFYSLWNYSSACRARSLIFIFDSCLLPDKVITTLLFDSGSSAFDSWDDRWSLHIWDITLSSYRNGCWVKWY